MLQQQTRPFLIKTPAFPSYALKRVDRWMSSVFDIDASIVNCSKQAFGNPVDDLNFHMGRRGQLLINTFLQFANIPAFRTSKTIMYRDDEETPGTLEYLIPIAVIEQTQARVYKIAVSSAFSIIQWMVKHEVTPEHRVELQNIVEQKCRKPIRKFITGGKTTLPLLKVAYEKNIPFTHLGSAEYVLGWGAKSRLMLISTCDSDSAIGSKAAQNKVKTAQMLDLFGLPNPDQLVVSTKKAALTAAKRLGGKVVVKPVDRDRGEGVTIGIRNIEHLAAAFDSAKKFSKGPVIIEKEVPGVCHRLLISNGALLYAIKRNPISVAGNGKNTVKELINALESVERSKSPWLNPRRYPSDQYASVIMKNNGHSLDSKPKKGELVALRPFQSDAWGGTPEDVTSEVHVDNIAIAIKAAKVFGLNNAGIDIISSDITQPWHSNAAIINEVNFSPNMGASEIARNALPKFLESFINGDGRIPVDVYVGSGSALKVAIKKHKAQLKKGIKSSLTSHKLTLHLSEEEAHLPYTSLIRRCKAMLLDREVEALVVVVETTECLFNLMPFDAINSLTIVDSDLYSWKNKDKKALAEEVGDLHQLFKKTKQSTKNKNNV